MSRKLLVLIAAIAVVAMLVTGCGADEKQFKGLQTRVAQITPAATAQAPLPTPTAIDVRAAVATEIAKPTATVTTTPTPDMLEVMATKVAQLESKQAPATPTQPPAPANTPTPMPTATTQPPAPAALASTPNTTSCEKGLAWQNDNHEDGSLYGEAPVGGLSESRWIVGQTWTDRPTTERWIYAIKPGTVVWLSGHRGGSAWYLCGEAAAMADLEKQKNDVQLRDGDMKTTVVILPEQASLFRLVTRTRSTSPVVSAQITAAPTTSVATPTIIKTTTTNTLGSSSCIIPGISTGPAILQGVVNNVATVVKLNAGQKFQHDNGACWSFQSQAALDARWPGHKSEFMLTYPQGTAIEK